MGKNERCIGIGTDIISIERFEKAYTKHGKSFIDKLFTPNEQIYCNKHSNPLPFFAARFSAKEAISKSLGCGFGEKLSFLDIEISKDLMGKPYVTLSKGAMERFNNPTIHLSLSHCKQYATASAIAFD
jgi:holo-[acyl-carrier protein] synthase